MSDGIFRKLLEATKEVGRRSGLPVPGVEEDEIDAAVDVLATWVGEEVDDKAIRAVLWGIAMEKKNSDVVDKAIDKIYSEHAREMEADTEDEDELTEPEVTEDTITLPRPKEAPVRAPGKKKQRPSTPLRPRPGQRPEPKGEENPDVVLFKKRRMAED